MRSISSTLTGDPAKAGSGMIRPYKASRGSLGGSLSKARRDGSLLELLEKLDDTVGFADL